MKYKYVSTIDRAYKGRVWFSDTPRLLTEEEADQLQYIKPYRPKRIRLVNDQTLEDYCKEHQLVPMD